MSRRLNSRLNFRLAMIHLRVGPSHHGNFLAFTIIGIPFAWADLKLAVIALWPISKMIVAADDAPLRYPRTQV
jgi:uncharacterized membrane protein YccF (DUF307 family)